MPNWMENKVHVTGEEIEINRLIEFVKSGYGVFDFNKIVPMPDTIKNINCGSKIINGVIVNHWVEQDFEDKSIARLVTKEEQEELNKIGYNNWYDWAVDNWGVKWNAKEAKIRINLEGCKEVEYRFDTPWDAPDKVYKKLIQLFPKLRIKWLAKSEEDFEFNIVL